MKTAFTKFIKRVEKTCRTLEQPTQIKDYFAKVEGETLFFRFYGEPLLGGAVPSVEVPLEWKHWSKLKDQSLWYHLKILFGEAEEHIVGLVQKSKEQSNQN